jgi:cbb3-type cytochrome oxidase subunit 1
MGINFLKIAVIYLVIGTLLGFTMGITQKFVLVPVHAHLLLLGWASLALAGVVYHLYPAASTTRLARFHFWLHNLGLPVFMLGLGLLLTGSHSALPLAIIGAITVLLGLVLFAANVLLNIKSAALSV